jgi:hypothetical protein
MARIIEISPRTDRITLQRLAMRQVNHRRASNLASFCAAP